MSHNPHAVTKQFEAMLAEYTGAPYVCVVNSCTMALRLVFDWIHASHGSQHLRMPARTYVSVPTQAIQAGHTVEFVDCPWRYSYAIYIPASKADVYDSAHHFHRDMFGGDTHCLSFHSQKPLGLEQGGAILHDDAEAQHWYERARFDGRTPGVPVREDTFSIPVRYRHHCYINPSTAALGVQRLYALMHHDGKYPLLRQDMYADNPD